MNRWTFCEHVLWANLGVQKGLYLSQLSLLWLPKPHPAALWKATASFLLNQRVLLWGLKIKPFLWPPRYSMMLTVLWRFQQWFLQRQVFSFCLRFAKHRHWLRGSPGLRVGLHKRSPLKCSFFSCLCRTRERLWSLIWPSSDLVFLPAPSYHLTWSMSSAKHSLSSQWALFLDPPVPQSKYGLSTHNSKINNHCI